MVGGSGGGTSVQRTEPWTEAKPYYERLYQRAEEAYGKTDKTGYTGKRVPDANANTIEAQNKMLAFVPGGGTGFKSVLASGAAPFVPQATPQPLPAPMGSRPMMPLSPTLMQFLAQAGFGRRR